MLLLIDYVRFVPRSRNGSSVVQYSCRAACTECLKIVTLEVTHDCSNIFFKDNIERLHMKCLGIIVSCCTFGGGFMVCREGSPVSLTQAPQTPAHSEIEYLLFFQSSRDSTESCKWRQTFAHAPWIESMLPVRL